MSVQTVLPIDRDSITQLSGRKNEPQWMLDLRVKALESAASLELPKLEKTRIDRWNLSSFGTYKETELASSPDQLEQQVQDLLQAEGDAVNVIVQRNSGIAWKQISEQLSAQGVVFSDLETALQSHSELVKKYFMTVVKPEENRLTALHAAMWNGGVFLYVPRNVHVELPIQALFYADEADTAFAPHVLIVAEANSSVTYVDNYFSADGLNLV
ncbi:MAG: Fe-S cluster assembly protein SufD, partial [Paenibacillus sp.]|nr:Fe-S cluster assembly protein SufD [Paenibacillus sp.]